MPKPISGPSNQNSGKPLPPIPPKKNSPLTRKVESINKELSIEHLELGKKNWIAKPQESKANDSIQQAVTKALPSNNEKYLQERPKLPSRPVPTSPPASVLKQLADEANEDIPPARVPPPKPTTANSKTRPNKELPPLPNRERSTTEPAKSSEKPLVIKKHKTNTN